MFVSLKPTGKLAFMIFTWTCSGQFGSSWGDSGALRNSDACTPEMKVKRCIFFDVTKHPILHFQLNLDLDLHL